jgi:hypothetical protein
MKQAASLMFSLVLLGLSTGPLMLPVPQTRLTDIEIRPSSPEVISPTRRIDWTQAGVSGGIPDRADGTCATLGPSATASDINSAIAACENGVVSLKTGTYTLSSGITFKGSSNVTLRGAGPEQTILKFTGSDPCGGYAADICIQGSEVWSGNVPAGNIRQWIAGYNKAANEIVLDSAAGLSVGSVIILDQLNDTADTGGVIVSDALGKFSLDSAAPGRKNRAQQQFVRVTGINGDRVTISPGVYMPNWRASQQPQVWWWGETAFLNGVENLTVDHSQSSEMSGIVFHNAYNGWVKNVKSLNAKRNHVWLNQAARIEVRDSYFYGTKHAASQSYGVEAFTTSDDLVVNNIFEHVTSPIMVGPSAGSVFAYNFMTDMHYATPTWMMAGIFGGHDAGTGMNLFEGNVANQFSMDLSHGTGSLATLFRNRLTGTESGKTQWANTIPINIWAFNRFINVVGNVLGTSRHHRVYEDSVTPLATRGQPERSIFVLGFSGSSEQQPLGNDPLVIATMLRWGNFDYATNQVRWNPDEIPSGEPVPATRTLPASLFLSARPAWWGAMPWPAIGPDVAGGADPAGHAHKIPAQVCFESSSRSADSTLVFDARNCYRSAS